MEENEYSPWANRDELFRQKRILNKDIIELTNFLYNTKDIQVSFIFERLENSLEKMLEIAADAVSLEPNRIKAVKQSQTAAIRFISSNFAFPITKRIPSIVLPSGS